MRVIARRLFALLIVVCACPAYSGAEMNTVPVIRATDPLCKSNAAYLDDFGEVCLVGKHGIDVTVLYGKTARLLGDNKNDSKIRLFIVRKIIQVTENEVREPSGTSRVYTVASDQTASVAIEAPTQSPANAPLAYQPVGNQSSPFLSGVPQCGQSTFENGYLIIVNACSSQIYVAWTSNGDVWGAASLGPSGRTNTGQSSNAVSRAGGVRIFACPGSAIPEGTTGVAIAQHYAGEYRCRK